MSNQVATLESYFCRLSVMASDLEQEMRMAMLLYSLSEQQVDAPMITSKNALKKRLTT